MRRARARSFRCDFARRADLRQQRTVVAAINVAGRDRLNRTKIPSSPGRVERGAAADAAARFLGTAREGGRDDPEPLRSLRAKLARAAGGIPDVDRQGAGDLRRAHARQLPRLRRPDDRRHRTADGRRARRRAVAVRLDLHGVHARCDDLHPALREARRRLRQAPPAPRLDLVFLVGSAACGLARSMPVLIGFRALQGLGAGGLVPLSMATVGSVVPLRDRGRYQGFIVSAFAGGAGVGPLLGGSSSTTRRGRGSST